MNSFALFTDVSVNPQRKLGVGGYLLLPVPCLEIEAHNIDPDKMTALLRVRRFAGTSCTTLEVQTVVWAVQEIHRELSGSAPGILQIYTDSQCVSGLLGRRAALEKSGFIARSSGRPLAHAGLYREFYAAYDRIGFQLIKVAGHSPAGSHDSVRRIFSYVDRGVRKALGIWMGEEQQSGMVLQG